MSLWTIYDHPTDYPDGYVVRQWFIIPGEGAAPQESAHYAPTLEAAREYLPAGLWNLGKQYDDDPAIAETWI